MSKHPHNQIILQSNQMKLLHFREALGGKKDTFSSSFANPEHSQSSLGGGHVCSPSLSRFLALEGHFVPKQNYSSKMCERWIIKNKKRWCFSLIWLHCQIFFTLHPRIAAAKIWRFQFAFTAFYNVYRNIHSQEPSHLLIPPSKGKRSQRNLFLIGCEVLVAWLTALTANKAWSWIVKRIHVETRKYLPGISHLTNNSFAPLLLIDASVYTGNNLRLLRI